MTVTIPAKFEEGTLTVPDQETITPATGWTAEANLCSVDRIGGVVFVNLAVAYADKAAATVCTLPEWYQPAATITSDDGKFTVESNGAVKYTGSTEPAAWVEATEYAAAAFVTEGGKIYKSKVGANKEHKPATSPTQWEEVANLPTEACQLFYRGRITTP